MTDGTNGNWLTDCGVTHRQQLPISPNCVGFIVEWHVDFTKYFRTKH